MDRSHRRRPRAIGRQVRGRDAGVPRVVYANRSGKTHLVRQQLTKRSGHALLKSARRHRGSPQFWPGVEKTSGGAPTVVCGTKVSGSVQVAEPSGASPTAKSR